MSKLRVIVALTLMIWFNGNLLRASTGNAEEGSVVLMALKFIDASILANDIRIDQGQDLIIHGSLTPEHDEFYDILTRHFNRILQERSDVDLLLTPEYLLFIQDSEYVFITLRKEEDHFEILESYPSRLAEFIKNMQSLAKNYQVNMILGTVLVSIDGSTDLGKFNTQLIINKDGIISDIHAKIERDFESISDIRRKEFLLEHTKPITLSTKTNQSFRVLPIICADTWIEDILNYESGWEADVVAISFTMGTYYFDWYTEYLQTQQTQRCDTIHGIWQALSPSSYFPLPYREGRDLTNEYYQGARWEWRPTRLVVSPNPILIAKQIEQRFSGLYVPRRIIKADGYFMVSDVQGLAGIFSADKKSMLRWEMTPDFIYGSIPIPQQIQFIRGDANRDNNVDLSDAIAILWYLFAGEEFSCWKALDVNDDGVIDISDAIYLLEFLYCAQEDPPQPFPRPGFDPTPDELSCR